MAFTVTELDASTWDLFAEPVERNNGVFGGCWCIGFHAEAPQKGLDHRRAQQERVARGRAHAALVLDDAGIAQGWCQWGNPEELSNIKHGRVYRKEPPPVVDSSKPSRRSPRSGQAHGRFLYSATVEQFEDFGFTRRRQVGKHAWIVDTTIQPNDKEQR